MSTTGFTMRTAWHNLWRGGQRAFLALLCIAFGVMSLIAMLLLSLAIDRVLVLQPGELLAADISLGRQTEDFIPPQHITALTELRQAGEIQNYTLVAYTSPISYHRPGSGEVHFAATGLGIDPAVYPLAGRLRVDPPGNTGAATLLQAEGDVLITRDIAEETGLQTGDEVILTDLQVGLPVAGRVRGIAMDTPNHQGSKIYYSLGTAARLVGRESAVNTALVQAEDPARIAPQLEASGWNVSLASQAAARQHETQDLFDLLLKGCGLLGLLVGGIGVANTMQVLLRHRQTEVAIWKTLGYSQSQLQLLFAGEAALLGLAGSLIGAGAGLGVSYELVRLVNRTGNLLINWTIEPLPIISGILVGVMTSLIFALWAIGFASQAKPMALLRNEPVNASPLSRGQQAILAIALGLPFTAVNVLVMGSLWKGVIVLLVGLVGLALLGGLLGGLAWAASRWLPLRGLPLAHMAQNNLRRRGLSLIFAMIALFIGIVTLTLGAAVVQNARQTMVQSSLQIEGNNLQLIAPAGQDAAVRQALKDVGVEDFNTSSLTLVTEIRAHGAGTSIQPQLVGRVLPDEYQIQGAPWGSQPEGVYAFQADGIPVGSQVLVVFRDGRQQGLQVVGTYSVEWNGASLTPPNGLLLQQSLSRQLAQPDLLTYYVEAPPNRLADLATRLGTALPGTTVINLQAYAERFILQIHNLFVLATAMAGLAILAGMLLVANSVSLALLDRRSEIGVLKVVGYARHHILVSLAIEYGLVALIATTAGLVAVQVFLAILSLANHLAGELLVLSLPATLWIGLVGVGLILSIVLQTAWGPIQASPVVVLNEKD